MSAPLSSDRQGNTKISVEYHQSSAQYFTERLSNEVGMQMMLILGGDFTMGAPETELDSEDSERPQHRVKVPTFLMGKYPVTQEQWQVIMQNNPSSFKGEKLPVEGVVSWNNAKEFCNILSKRTSRKYRLPSEAEWEYACRAGTTTPFHFGETISTDLANYQGTDNKNFGWSGSYGMGELRIYREKTTKIGSFPPNYYGLCDMHGNVWEWCEDTWHDNYENAPSDGSAWVDKEKSYLKVLRGGSWFHVPNFCRSASRIAYSPGIDFTFGFRVVCEVSSVIS